MKLDETFDSWWDSQDSKPAVQKGTMRRGWRMGEATERAKLRPLLKRCLEVADAVVEAWDRPFLAAKAADLVTDLRRELGEET